MGGVMSIKPLIYCLAALALLATAAPGPAFAAEDDDAYTENEILNKAIDFFGATTKGLAGAIQKAFKDQGRPNAFILGEEASVAFGIGVRYGKGKLNRKKYKTIPIFWQGPSVGFDAGGNASKVFALIYHLKKTDDLFHRFPGVEGSFYFVAGIGLNYQQSGEVIVAPIRTGVGLRAGANIGYLHYTHEHSWIPL